MTEAVTITPDAGRNSDGDPTPLGTPFTVYALVAPGNSLLQYNLGGDLDAVEFTAYLPLRVRVDGEWVSVADRATDSFRINIRDRDCKGRLQTWDVGGQGGVAVLAHSGKGRS